jgi:hypothetical protein
MLTYSFTDYTDIKLSNPKNVLPEDVITIYNQLVKQLNISMSVTNEVEYNEKEKDKDKDKDRRYNKKIRQTKKPELVASYKQLEFKERMVNEIIGPEKIMINITGCFNKLSTKNYNTHRDLLFSYLNELNELNDESYLIHSSNQFFDVACRNSFYSEMYANLYTELTKVYPIFEERKEQFIMDCVDNLDTIQYVDETTDYEGFCKNNKKNDIRRSMNVLLINLYKKNECTIQDIFKIMNLIMDKITQCKHDAEQVHVIEELTENLYIFISALSRELKEHIKWNSIYEFIDQFSKIKISDYSGLTSRIKFKYMDMIDAIKKNN